MSFKNNFENEELISDIVRDISEKDLINWNQKERNCLVSDLAMVSLSQQWYYITQLCFPALFDVYISKNEHVKDSDLIDILLSFHRVNEALYLKEHGRKALAERLVHEGFCLPMKIFNILWTSKLAGIDTIHSMITDIHNTAQKIPQFIRKKWVERSLYRRCSNLNRRLLWAADSALGRHMMATGVQWDRAAKNSQDEAIRIRINYNSGYMVITIKYKEFTKSKRKLLHLHIDPLPVEEEFRNIEAHFTLRFLSILAFKTISQIREKYDIEKINELLHYWYKFLICDILNEPEIIKNLENISGYPTLIIATHGIIAQIPFSALYDGERYLAERFNIVQAAPLFADKDFEEGELDYETVWGGNAMKSRSVRVVSGGENLPQISYEIDDLLALSTKMGFPLEVWPDENGKDWNADTLRWLLGTSGIALLSAHMMASSKHASQAIIVSPGGKEIEAGDAITEPINAGLVLLSGCQSASFSDWFAPDESSLVSICRKAGAQSVVSTLWPARDYPARLYNVEMIAGLNRGLTRAAAHGAALRHVMSTSANIGKMHYNERLIRKKDNKNIELRDQESLLNHPHYWACFILTGAWR